jgi:hypothetical protein
VAVPDCTAASRRMLSSVSASKLVLQAGFWIAGEGRKVVIPGEGPYIGTCIQAKCYVQAKAFQALCCVWTAVDVDSTGVGE